MYLLIFFKGAKGEMGMIDLQGPPGLWEFLAGVVFLVSKVIFRVCWQIYERKKIKNFALHQYGILLFDCLKMSNALLVFCFLGDMAFK